MSPNATTRYFRGSFFLVIAAALLVVGCGMPPEVKDSPTVSSSEAAMLSNALIQPTSSVQKLVIAELAKLQDPTRSKETGASTWIKQSLEIFTMEHTVNNPEGSGSIDVTGNGGYRDKTFTLKLQLDFHAWEVDQLEISGTIHMDFQLSASGALLTKTTLQGTLKVKGLLQAQPDLEIPVQVSLEVTTHNTEVTACGSVAGVPVQKGTCSQP
ncbi:MAG: hypothetical protein EP343_19645 [Deltaproteobacteria bacterium]|nr:MAG: hypothetical protein EP343_19645 [Deltaproteobacteria bacterium]